jgi:hypothetical protein
VRRITGKGDLIPHIDIVAKVKEALKLLNIATANSFKDISPLLLLHATSEQSKRVGVKSNRDV